MCEDCKKYDIIKTTKGGVAEEGKKSLQIGINYASPEVQDVKIFDD